ncbi:MAG: aldehyde dehydrogenase family protein [Bacteroidia bacterium]
MAATKTVRKTTAARTTAKPAITNGQAEKTSNGVEIKQNDRIAVMKTYKIFINGQFPRTESGRYYTINTSEGTVLNMCLSSRKDFRNAVVAARNAQEKWEGKTAYNRSQIIYRIAEMLETRRAQFEQEIVSLGISAELAKKEVSKAIDTVIYYAGWCDKYNQIFSTVNPVASSHFNFSSTEAVGVVAMFADENSPLLGFIAAVMPVICSGNTAIVLASEKYAPCAVTFAEVLATSDVPAGVLNILTGKRSELLSHFASHMDVNAMYAHTSDAALKKEIDTKAALNVKRVRIDSENDWFSDKAKSPYRIMDFLEIKTTWHPIGI